MKRGFILSLPAVSTNNTVLCLAEELSSKHYELIFYNTSEFIFKKHSRLNFKSYPPIFNYNYSHKIDETTSYFEFGKILIEIADLLHDFLVEEVNLEKPDFIILSHLAPWGRFLSNLFNIPAITVYSTFVLDRDIMLPYFRKLNQSVRNPGNTNEKELQKAISLNHQCKDIARKYFLKEELNLWEIYTNQTDLNLCFIMKEFQPLRSFLKTTPAYVGYPKKTYNRPNKKKNLVYIAMGTVLHKESGFFQSLIDTIAFLNLNSVIAVGKSYSVGNFKKCPSNIKIVSYADQIEMLNKSWLFITHGGMSSVHESIYSNTPMIVLPTIPEQCLIADKIVEFGIGLKLDPRKLTGDSLSQAILEIQNNKSFQQKLNKLNSSVEHSSASEKAVRLIENFLHKKSRTNLVKRNFNEQNNSRSF